MKLESLNVAKQHAEKLVIELRNCLQTGTATDSLIILPLIGDATCILLRIEALLSAINMDANDTKETQL